MAPLRIVRDYDMRSLNILSTSMLRQERELCLHIYVCGCAYLCACGYIVVYNADKSATAKDSDTA